MTVDNCLMDSGPISKPCQSSLIPVSSVAISVEASLSNLSAQR
jgi:hypothetical protein